MKKNVKNLPEFKALIERYKTIPLEEIKGAFKSNRITFDVKAKLTGFGKTTSCSLCLPITNLWTCYGCIYTGPTGCTRHKTYGGISSARDPESLLAAYRARAAYMETLIKL